MPKHPHEDTISANLVDVLNGDPEVRRRFHWIEFQYEPFGYTVEGTAYSTGSVDIAVLLNQDRDIYLAYECKRLNDVRKDGRRSLAGDYVTDGLSRFVAEQYAEGLPLAVHARLRSRRRRGARGIEHPSENRRAARGGRPRSRTAGRRSHRRVETLLQPSSSTIGR